MTKKATRSRRKERSLLWRLGRFLLLLSLLLGFYWSQQNLIQTEVIEEPGAPEAFNGLRIALISDLHGKEFGEDNQILLEKIKSLHPDFIAITGDLVHETGQFGIIPPLATGLCAIAPTYYVTGNHEWATREVPKIKELLQEGGVTVLSNEYVAFEREGQTLALLGADDNNGNADQKTIHQLADEVREKEGKDAFLLLLSHRNNRYQTYIDAGIDLTLCGHAHGGQVRLPFTDGLIGPHREWFPTYTAGRYQLSFGDLIVSRGLSDKAPAFRLFNCPDVPLIILRAAP